MHSSRGTYSFLCLCLKGKPVGLAGASSSMFGDASPVLAYKGDETAADLAGPAELYAK